MLQWLAAVGAVVCRQLGFPSVHPNPAQWRLQQQTSTTTAGTLAVQCGGGEEDLTRRSCVTWRDGDWVTSHHLLYSRIYHSSWDSPLGILLLGGTSASTAELLHQNGTTTILFYLIDNLR